MTAVRARLAVVGAGRIGRLHARNLASRVPSADLAAVVDRDMAVAQEVASECEVGAFGCLEDALDGGEVDGVVVAAPPRAHAELVKAAAAAGKPVLCEKPLGLDPAAAREAVAAAATAGVELRVAFQRRFDPGWLALRDEIANGRLGTVRLFRVSHRNAKEPPNREQLGDVLFDLAVHDLDAALWLAGPVDEVLARTNGGNGSATISLRFRNGALGLIDVDRSAGYGFECSAEIVGARGTARLGDCHGTYDVRLLESGRVSSWLPRDHVQRHDLAYVAELDAFGRLANGECGAADAGASGEDAVAALELARAAERSAAS